MTCQISEESRAAVNRSDRGALSDRSVILRHTGVIRSSRFSFYYDASPTNAFGMPSELPRITMNHSNAPATALVATQCCVCALPLVDSDSVEIGIGPICRKKLAKQDVGQPANWLAAVDSLMLFADDTDERRGFLMMVIANIDSVTKVPHDAHKLANQITHYIAATQHRDDPKVGALIDALAHIGRPTLASKLRKKLYVVRIEYAADNRTLLVHAPYSEIMRDGMWSGGSRLGVWSKLDKAYSVPMTCAGSLWKVLLRAYPGASAHGPKGEFRIGA